VGVDLDRRRARRSRRPPGRARGDAGAVRLERELGAAPRRGAVVEVEAPVGELGAVVVHGLVDEHPAPLNSGPWRSRCASATSTRSWAHVIEISISGNPTQSISSRESRPTASYLDSIVGIK
jgi:hypothetical protein